MRGLLPVTLAVLVAGCLGGSPGLPLGAPPTIDARLELVPEVAAILDAVAQSAPVTLPVVRVTKVSGFGLPFNLTLRLAPSSVMNESSWVEVEARRVNPPPFGLLEGEVEGRTGSEARLAWTPTWARGIVLLDSTLHYVFVGPAPHRGPPLIYNVPIPSGTDPIEVAVPFDLAEASPNAEDCQRLQPDLSRPTTTRGRFTGRGYALDVIADGDALYAKRYGDDAFPLLAAYMNDVDAIFEHEFGLRIRLVSLHLHSDPSRIPPEQNPLGPLARYWNNRTDVERDHVHLFSGRPQYGAQANCIGGAGKPEVAYSFVPAVYGDRDANSALVTTAHEIGHILAAHHHYGNVHEGEGATVMLHSYLPGNRPIFGSLERSVIRGWIEGHLRALGDDSAAHNLFTDEALPRLR